METERKESRGEMDDDFSQQQVTAYQTVSEGVRPDLNRGGSTRGQFQTTDMVLTAQDLQDPLEEDARTNHDRSQELLQQILKHRGISVRGNTVAFVHDEAEDLEKERFVFTKRISGRLRTRGIHSVRTFRVMLHHMDLHANGTCLGRTLEGALTSMGIRLTRVEYDQLISLFSVGDEDLVDYVQFLAYTCSNWSTQREEVVQEAFEYLSEICAGSLLTVSAIETQFNMRALTQELVPDLVEHNSNHEFLNQWHACVLGADGIVTWLDFVDYYLDVSLCFDSEQDFCQYVCKSWGIDMDDWLAKKVFRRYSNSDNENVLPTEDFMVMLDELYPNISKEEALAWYNAIDEDDSGEVSLEEFLSSKVLKVKRLFDQYDTDNSRIICKDKMLAILQSLNPMITAEEASALYTYADMDGSGELSFSEFLANNLLKFLQIFDQFGHSRNHCFNEAEMKKLLRKQDPFLDDHEVLQCYKAIDTDGSGSISFIEFCESHVLRAKQMFDRYDTARSRTLSQFKFRELLIDMDDTLTTTQMEAIYTLVADHHSGKVHLGGFLNPNIVKIKTLFDKYDQDRSRYLDASEFRAMLKDMYKSASEKELETLLRVICPPGGDSGVTFTMYVQRFKEIHKKHEQMHLAKRREARARAANKGLVYVESD